MLAQRTAKEATQQRNSAGSRVDQPGLLKARQSDRDAAEPAYWPGQSRDNQPSLGLSSSGSSWDLSQISILAPEPKPQRASHDIKTPTRSAVSKPGEAAEREADAFAEWFAAPSAPRWTEATARHFSPETQAYS